MHTQIQSLFNQVSTIVQKYEKIAELTGENFNVFRILRLSTYEVRTHSAFIAELLNPNGSHGQKGKFLKLFTEQLNISGFDCENARLEVEKYIGPISEDGKEGGNIDIIIADRKNNKAIIIENKIYAVDQKFQLLRYYNYGKKSFPESHLLYLTLYGKEASSLSKGELDKIKYDKISYQSDILKWVEKCKEKSVNYPILRESLTQYIHLIKFLTGKAMNNEMEKELLKVVLDKPGNIKIALAIENLKYQIFDCILERLKEQISEIKIQDVKIKFSDNEIPFGKSDSYVSFYKDKWKNYISFCFNSDYCSLLIGIDSNSDKNSTDKKNDLQITQRLEKFNFGEVLSYSNWVWVSTFKEWEEIDWAEVESKAPESIKNTVEKIVKELDDTL